MVAGVTFVLLLGAMALYSPLGLAVSRGAVEFGTASPVSSGNANPPAIPLTVALVQVPDHEYGVAIAGAVPLGGAVSGTLHVLVTLPYAHSSELTAFLQAVSDPSSPDYHHYLTAAQFDAAYGQPASVYDTLLQYFGSFGVAGLTSYPDRASISFEGTPTEVAAAFHTGIANYRASGRDYFAPTGPLSVPATLAPYVGAVEGLSDYSNYLIQTDLAGGNVAVAGAPSAPMARAQPDQGSGPCSAFTCTTVDNLSYPEPVSNFYTGSWYAEMLPAPDLQIPYNVTPVYQHYGYQTSGERTNTIATLLWTDQVQTTSAYGTFCEGLNSADWAWDFYAPDVSNYFNYTLPVGESHSQVTSVPLTGFTYAYPAGSQGLSASCNPPLGPNIENSVDVEMAGSMAPGASIYQLFGGSTDIQTTVDTEFADVLNPTLSEFSSTGGSDTAATVAGLENVSVISNSWTNDATDIACIEENDSSWFNGLAQAQARGITVLAGSGDFATGQPCTPAAQAYNTVGDIAVGGTTITLNPTTLARTSEIVWDVLPCGKSPHVCEGTGGGVSTTFPEPTWQKASADANAVITAVGSGRGAPDIAAAANDTMIDYTEAGTTYNVTGYLSGSGPFFMGTSFATPLEAGIVNQLNFALAQSGAGRLGFLDPEAYLWGQEQYQGSVSKLPFYDVTQGQALYPALPGYDLATGWGPINASGWAALSSSFASVTFTASGLPAGKSWAVTLSGLRQSSSSASIVFHEPIGTDSYSVAPPGGYYASPIAGQVTVSISAVNVSVEILINSTVTFRETGLPTGLAWNVSFDNGPFQESKTTTDVFHVQNMTGSYPFTVADSWIGTTIVYEPSPQTGNVEVNQGAEQVNVTYTEHTVCPRCLLPRPGGASTPDGSAPADPSSYLAPSVALAPTASLRERATGARADARSAPTVTGAPG